MDEVIGTIEGVIAQTGLRSYYENWHYPWYFPSVEEYKALLTRVGFVETRVFVKAFVTRFSSAREVVDFFKGAGFHPYLSPLPEEKKGIFLKGFREMYAAKETPEGIEIVFNRLFATATREQ